MSLNANARKIIRDATVEVPLAPLLAPLEPLDFGRELNSAVSALSLCGRRSLSAMLLVSPPRRIHAAAQVVAPNAAHHHCMMHGETIHQLRFSPRCLHESRAGRLPENASTSADRPASVQTDPRLAHPRSPAAMLDWSIEYGRLAGRGCTKMHWASKDGAVEKTVRAAPAQPCGARAALQRVESTCSMPTLTSRRCAPSLCATRAPIPDTAWS